MLKPVIVFDMDDTLCVLTDAAVELIKSKFSYTVSSSVLHTEWYDAVHPNYLQEFKSAVYNRDFYMGLRPKFDPQALYNLLFFWQDIFDFEIVTHRSKPLGANAESITRDWLAKYHLSSFFKAVKPLHFDTNKSLACTHNTVMILDDSIRVHNDFINNRKTVRFCYVDNPWNTLARTSFDRIRSVHCFNRVFKKLAIELNLAVS